MNSSANEMLQDKLPLDVTMGLVAFGICGMIVTRLLYMLANRRRARKVATWDAGAIAAESQSTERRGDQRYTFVFAL